MSYLEPPYESEPPCFCGQQAPGPVLTTAEHCPACGDPNAPVIEPEGNDDEPAYGDAPADCSCPCHADTHSPICDTCCHDR